MFLFSRGGRPLAALTIGAGLCAVAPYARAQAAPPASAPAAPDVGQPAPDFTAPGATRYGLLRDPIKLSDFRGKTVVLAFFFKARTKG